MADIFHRTLSLEGPTGRLEAILWNTPAAGPHLAALVCHPHPLYGGTMHNKVVYQAAKSLHTHGIPVLRFNFRGTGESEGVHDHGHGEEADVRAALAYLAAEFPARLILLAGFSFGATVGLRVGCQDPRVSELIGLGIPVDNVSLEYLRACAKPKLIIQGAKDEYGSRGSVEALFQAMPGAKRLVFVEDADHFFTGRLDQVAAAIDAWLEERHNFRPTQRNDL